MLIQPDGEINVTTETLRLQYSDKLRLIGRDARLTILCWMGWAFAYGINDVVFNLYLLDAGFGEDFIGFFISVSILVGGALALFAGMVADRLSRKRILLFGNIAVLISFIIIYTTLTPAVLLFAQVINGFGFAFNGVSWQPYTTSVTTKEERVHVFSMRFAFYLCANLIGSLVGGFLPPILMSLGIAMGVLSAYQMTLWIALIPMVFGVLTIVPMAVDKPEKKERIGISNVRNRGFIGKYALMWTVSGFGAGLFVHTYNLFFKLTFAVDSATIGLMFAASTIIMAGGNFLSPIIVDRYGKFWTIVWCHLLSIPFLLLLAWSPVLYFAFIGFASRNLFMNVAWPVMEVFYMEGLDKEEQSTAMGVITTGDSLVRGVALNVTGWLLAAGFLRAPFALASIFYFLSVLLFYYFFRDEKSETPALE